MLKFKAKALFMLCAVLGGVQMAQAHFVWARFNGAKLCVDLAEAPGEPGLAVFADRKDKLTMWTQPRVERKDSPVLVNNTAEVPAGDKAVGGAHINWGVMDRASAGRGVFLLEYHAKAVRSLAEAGRSAGLGVEVFAKVEGNEVVVTVQKEGKPVKADIAFFNWFNPQAPPDEGKPFVTNDQGVLRLPLPKGSFGIRAHVEEKKTGSVGDQKYELVRHYSTLCVGEGKA